MGGAVSFVTKTVKSVVGGVSNVAKKPKVPEIQLPSYEELKKEELKKQEEEKPKTSFFSEALMLRKRKNSIGLGLDGGGTTGSSVLGIPQ